MVAEQEFVRFPEEIRALHRAGIVYRFCGDAVAALAMFDRALRAHPRFHFTELEIAGIHLDRGNKQLALEWFRHAIDSEPDYPSGYLRAAELEREIGRSWSALELLQELYRRFPNHVEGNILRAELL